MEKAKKIPSRVYDANFKSEAVKLAEKIGNKAAAVELGIPDNTLYGWIRKYRKGTLTVSGEATKPDTANKLADENARLKQELREAQRIIAEEREINEILDKAARFFAVRQKK
jgi:transposase